MLVTNRRLRKEVGRLEEEIKWQESRFEELRNEFWAVLRHLNLETYRPTSGIRVREKSRVVIESEHPPEAK